MLAVSFHGLCIAVPTDPQESHRIPKKPYRYDIPLKYRQRGLHVTTVTPAMETLAGKVLRGQQLNIYVTGGSFSALTSEAGPRGWIYQLAEGLDEWLESPISLNNMALGATTPALGRLCWEEFTRNEQPDLVFIE